MQPILLSLKRSERRMLRNRLLLLSKRLDDLLALLLEVWTVVRLLWCHVLEVHLVAWVLRVHADHGVRPATAHRLGVIIAIVLREREGVQVDLLRHGWKEFC